MIRFYNLSIFFFLVIIASHFPTIAQTQDKQTSEPSKIQSGYLVVNDGKLFYEMTGQGPKIIMIHDGLLHHETWDGQMAEFAKNFTVICYDRRGYGRSPQPTQPYSNIEDLHAIFEQLHVDSAALIGMSAGGGLAIDFTLQYPKKVTSLVLIGAVVSGFGYTDHMFTRGGHYRPEDRATPEANALYWAEKDPYEITPGNTAAQKRVKDLITANLQNIDPLKYQLNQGPTRPALPALHEIQVPALIVIGANDIPDCHAHAGAIAAGIPHAKRVIIPNAGHLVPLEQSEILNQQILDFYKSAKFNNVLYNKGVKPAILLFEQMRKKDPNLVPFTENEMNTLGYQRLLSGQIIDAIELFKLNVLAYPQSWNVYDSLGEAYMRNGDKDLAIKNYEKSLELNPGNTSAVEALKRLREE